MSGDELNHSVGRLIAAERRRAGLTQADLAERLGWPRDTLIHYEHGRRAISVDRLQAIAEALAIHPAVLLIDRPETQKLVARLLADDEFRQQIAFFSDTLETTE